MKTGVAGALILSASTIALSADVRSKRSDAPKRIEYPSFDGKKISAFYWSPRKNKEKLAPFVIVVHDWPSEDSGKEFEPLIQLLREHGFAVLAPEYRELFDSKGQGQNSEPPDWGGADAKDLIAAVEYAVASSLAHPHRVALFGTGYGGFLALSALAQSTQTWSATIAVAPITDFSLQYEMTKDRWEGWHTPGIGTPETNPTFFKDRSPISWAHKLRGPILLFHGANDSVVSRRGSDLLYATLLERRITVGLIVYPEEDHHFAHKSTRADFHRRVLKFFKKEMRYNQISE